MQQQSRSHASSAACVLPKESSFGDDWLKETRELARKGATSGSGSRGRGSVKMEDTLEVSRSIRDASRAGAMSAVVKDDAKKMSAVERKLLRLEQSNDAEMAGLRGELDRLTMELRATGSPGS